MSNASSSPFSIRISSPTAATALSMAAGGLAPGEWTDFEEGKNTVSRSLDIQWNTVTMYYDEARRELQYMGKPASSQSRDHRHYIYDEASNRWRTTGHSLFPGTGHIWSTAFDPINGNYYFHRWTDDFVWIMDRAVEAGRGEAADPWRRTSSQTDPELGGSNAGPVCALCWHPNLFGAGRPGLVNYGQLRLFAWNPAIDRWSLMDRYGSGSPYWAHRAGQGVFLPSSNQAILGTGRDNGQAMPLIWVDAGAGEVTSAISAGAVGIAGEPPLTVRGTGGTTNSARFLLHPNDPTRLLMLETFGSSRVWVSADAGASWDLQNYTHPFNNLPADSRGMWTCGSVPPYGVIWAMTSRGNGDGASRLWKPES
ncbi:MAG: hypothetical protein AAGF12_05870 [Myxococcota bacterium]